MNRPPVPATAATLAICALLAVTAQVALQGTYATVNAPMPLVAYGLEADPALLRGWFAVLEQRDTYLLLIRAELVDLTWPLALAATIVCLVRLVGALGWRRRPVMARRMVRFAPLFVLGPAFDLVENAFSFAILTDPAGFPGWWALAHAVAAHVKFALAASASLLGVVLTAIVALSPRSATEPETESDAAAIPSP